MKHLILWASFAATLGAAAAFLCGRDGAFEIFTITGLLTLGLFILVDEHEADKRWRARRYRADVWERRDHEAEMAANGCFAAELYELIRAPLFDSPQNDDEAAR